MKDQGNRAQDQFILLANLAGAEILKGTEAVYADKTFIEQFNFKMGDTIFEIRHSGQAHTPGDSFVWLPQLGTMFTGDIVYVDRMPGVGTQSNSKSWIGVFQTMADYKPTYLIPGHGEVTDLSHARKDTLDYLVILRKSVADFMENGGDIADIGSVDQSRYSYLVNYEAISGRNAQQVFTEMEWE